MRLIIPCFGIRCPTFSHFLLSPLGWHLFEEGVYFMHLCSCFTYSSQHRGWPLVLHGRWIHFYLCENPTFPGPKALSYSSPNEFSPLPLYPPHGLTLGIHAEGLGNFLAFVVKRFLSFWARDCTQGIQTHSAYLTSEEAHASGSLPWTMILAS